MEFWSIVKYLSPLPYYSSTPIPPAESNCFDWLLRQVWEKLNNVRLFPEADGNPEPPGYTLPTIGEEPVRFTPGAHMAKLNIVF